MTLFDFPTARLIDTSQEQKYPALKNILHLMVENIANQLSPTNNVDLVFEAMILANSVHRGSRCGICPHASD